MPGLVRASLWGETLSTPALLVVVDVVEGAAEEMEREGRRNAGGEISMMGAQPDASPSCYTC